MFFQSAKHVKVQEGRVGAVRWVRWGPEMASGAGRLLVPPWLGKSHRILWQVPEQVWKNKELMSKDMCAFLISTYLNSRKKIRNLTFCLPLVKCISKKQNMKSWAEFIRGCFETVMNFRVPQSCNQPTITTSTSLCRRTAESLSSVYPTSHLRHILCGPPPVYMSLISNGISSAVSSLTHRLLRCALLLSWMPGWLPTAAHCPSDTPRFNFAVRHTCISL
jgi:hypothetical protein